MPSFTRTLAPIFYASLLAATSLAACSSDSAESGDCLDGKCDDVNPACLVSGIEENKDPIAELLIRAGTTCPKNALEMVQKLDEVSPCPGGPGLRTSVVSDGARFVDGPERYRTISTRSCGDEPDHALFFTLLNVNTESRLDSFTFVEMMAFDPESQLYNYYTNSSGNFSFEGTSIDAIEGNIGCGRCHNQGGPIMKELDRPWVHWDSGDSLPGVAELFANDPTHGQRRSARDLEKIIKGGNDALNAARTAHYSSSANSSVSRLLEPLFCSTELNLQTAGLSPGADIQSIPGDLVLDLMLAELVGLSNTDINMSQDSYADTITRLGQTIPSFSDQSDTAFKFLFPERSHVELSAVRALLKSEIIDNDFAVDVLSLDFTKPLRSPERCELLRFAPTLVEEIDPTAAPGSQVTELNAASIRQAFATAMTEESAEVLGTLGVELLAALGDTDDTDTQALAVENFLSLCRARPEQELMDDLYKVAEQARDEIRSLSIIENPTQVPMSDVSIAAGFRLSPEDCIGRAPTP